MRVYIYIYIYLLFLAVFFVFSCCFLWVAIHVTLSAVHMATHINRLDPKHQFAKIYFALVFNILYNSYHHCFIAIIEFTCVIYEGSHCCAVWSQAILGGYSKGAVLCQQHLPQGIVV